MEDERKRRKRGSEEGRKDGGMERADKGNGGRNMRSMGGEEKKRITKTNSRQPESDSASYHPDMR